MYTANDLRRTLQCMPRKPRRPVLGVLPDVANQSRPYELGTGVVSPQKPEPQPTSPAAFCVSDGGVRGIGEPVAIFEAEYRA